MSSNIVCVVSHDAGGAEILASYLAQNSVDYRLVLAGPAVSVFRRRLGSITLDNLTDAMAVSDWCLCGTSWQSDMEWHAIEAAKKAGKRVVAFLDHWVNYESRFLRSGVRHISDEIWVCDDVAKGMAQKHFPEIPIRLVPNPYFIDVNNQLRVLQMEATPSNREGRRVLFVCENTSEHCLLQHGDERYLGYTEFDAIEYFLENIHFLNEPIDRVIVRPHPSDPPGKYDQLISKHSGILQISDGKTLLEEIVDSDIVAGCESMALVVGLLGGRRVVSCIPPYGRQCCLPHKEIQILNASI